MSMAGLTAMAAPADSPAAPAMGERITTVIRPDLRTGKLVRSVVVAPHAVPQAKAVAPVAVVPRVINPVIPAAEPESKPPAEPMPHAIGDVVERIAAEQEVSPALIHSVIKVESNYNPNAVSRKGAQGLMQLIPSTAQRYGVANVFDPVDNIQGGARYLKHLLELYNGDYALALAAYNAGEGAVAKYGDIPPYPETVNYVQSVAAQLRKNAAAKSKSETKAKPAASGQKSAPKIVEIRQSDGSVRYVSQ